MVLKRIVVVGASLAGLRAVEALRREGYDGRLSLVGAEGSLPYDRPPLSKQVLLGQWEPDRIWLRSPDDYADLDLDLHLGRAATSLDLAGRAVTIDSGEELCFDGLIIATGAHPRMLPGVPDLAGIHVLRTLEDCLSIRRDLEAGGRVVVVGGGFIGAEVAASARQRGLDVTVLEALPVPLARVLGPEIGRVCAALHLDHGVALRCGVAVAAVEGDSRVGRVTLTDGTKVEADTVVIGVGVTPATGWLESSGLPIADGVICDAFCATEADGVYAAGDVARWFNPLFGEQMRVEHWTNAVEQGTRTARNLLLGSDSREAYASVPYFWSDQYDTKIHLVGRPSPEDDVRVAHGSIEQQEFVALFGRENKLRAALAFNAPALLAGYRRLIEEGASWDDALLMAASVE